MEDVDRVTICSHERRADLGPGKLKIGHDDACVHTLAVAERIRPDSDGRGETMGSSGDGDDSYTGEIVGLPVYDSSRHSRTAFRCKLADQLRSTHVQKAEFDATRHGIGALHFRSSPGVAE